jgi:hypothetical protein
MVVLDKSEINKVYYRKHKDYHREKNRNAYEMTKRSQSVALQEEIISFIREHPDADPIFTSIHFQGQVEHSVEDLLTQSFKEKNDISKGKAADTSQLSDQAKLLGRNFAGEFTGMKWSESVRKVSINFKYNANPNPNPSPNLFPAKISKSSTGVSENHPRCEDDSDQSGRRRIERHYCSSGCSRERKEFCGGGSSQGEGSKCSILCRPYCLQVRPNINPNPNPNPNRNPILTFIGKSTSWKTL